MPSWLKKLHEGDHTIPYGRGKHSIRIMIDDETVEIVGLQMVVGRFTDRKFAAGGVYRPWVDVYTMPVLVLADGRRFFCTNIRPSTAETALSRAEDIWTDTEDQKWPDEGGDTWDPGLSQEPDPGTCSLIGLPYPSEDLLRLFGVPLEQKCHVNA